MKRMLLLCCLLVSATASDAVPPHPRLFADVSGRIGELLVTTDAPDVHWEFRSVSEPRGSHDGANPGIGQLSFTVTPRHSGWQTRNVGFTKNKEGMKE